MSRLLLLAVFLLMLCSSLACSGPGKPWVNTLNPEYISDNSALLVGYVDESATADVFFQIYNVGGSPWRVSAGSVEGPNSFQETATGLTANTTYFFMAGAKVHGVTGWGPAMQFTTLPPAPAAPVIRTDNVTDITSQSAVLHGTIESMGGATSLIVDFKVKETSAATPSEVSYGVGTFYSAGTFSVTISVTPGSTYSYMAEGISIEGYSGDVYGAEKTFST